MENLEDEVWISVPGFGGHYEASNLGRIRVKDRIVLKPHSRTGAITEYQYKGRVLKERIATNGRPRVNVCVDAVEKTLYVHRLVLLAFKGEPPPGMEACHNNGNELDNRPGNLRWDTHHENNQDRKRHGTYLTGEDHHMATLSNEVVIAIYQSDERGVDIAMKYGTNSTVVSAIRNGHSWAAITGGVPRGPGYGWRKNK